MIEKGASVLLLQMVSNFLSTQRKRLHNMKECFAEISEVFIKTKLSMPCIIIYINQIQCNVTHQCEITIITTTVIVATLEQKKLNCRHEVISIRCSVLCTTKPTNWTQRSYQLKLKP